MQKNSSSLREAVTQWSFAWIPASRRNDALLVLVLLFFSTSLAAQERFSLFVPTEPDDVVRMLQLANVVEGDVIYDLGSGDGRIVLEAARRNPKVFGRGVEIDAKLVAESTAAARASGIDKRVTFLHQNAFDADLKEATVIVMWLWPELMRMLRPKILAEARPGTRVVTRLWDLGTWTPDETDTGTGLALYKWVVPAKVDGFWDWRLAYGGRVHNYSAVVEQRFQNFEGAVRVGDRRGLFDRTKLNGEEISFTLRMTVDGAGFARHDFSGRVRDGAIEGTVRISREKMEEVLELPWRATRVAKSAYFAPTGLNVK